MRAASSASRAPVTRCNAPRVENTLNPVQQSWRGGHHQIELVEGYARILDLNGKGPAAARPPDGNCRGDGCPSGCDQQIRPGWSRRVAALAARPQGREPQLEGSHFQGKPGLDVLAFSLHGKRLSQTQTLVFHTRFAVA